MLCLSERGNKVKTGKIWSLYGKGKKSKKQGSITSDCFLGVVCLSQEKVNWSQTYVQIIFVHVQTHAVGHHHCTDV